MENFIGSAAVAIIILLLIATMSHAILVFCQTWWKTWSISIAAAAVKARLWLHMPADRVRFYANVAHVRRFTFVLWALSRWREVTALRKEVRQFVTEQLSAPPSASSHQDEARQLKAKITALEKTFQRNLTADAKPAE